MAPNPTPTAKPSVDTNTQTRDKRPFCETGINVFHKFGLGSMYNNVWVAITWGLYMQRELYFAKCLIKTWEYIPKDSICTFFCDGELKYKRYTTLHSTVYRAMLYHTRLYHIIPHYTTLYYTTIDFFSVTAAEVSVPSLSALPTPNGIPLLWCPICIIWNACHAYLR